MRLAPDMQIITKIRRERMSKEISAYLGNQRPCQGREELQQKAENNVRDLQHLNSGSV